MSLPNKAIDRLFERLAATYGAGWTRQWADVPVNDVKTLWGHELSVYSNRLEALAWALDNLPEHAPNVIQFRNLCRSAPAPNLPKLPEPKADPTRLRAELLKLGEIGASVLIARKVDGRDWARRIIEKSDAGVNVNQSALKMAKSALGFKNA